MDLPELGRNAVSYIRERRCKDGGYCFYRLEEPNPKDTYHAVSAIESLGVPLDDPATERYLLEVQRPDGSYDSIYSVYHSVMALSIMGRTPERDPMPFVMEQLRLHRPEEVPLEVISAFGSLHMAVNMCHHLGDLPQRPVREEIIRFVEGLRCGDGGFGRPRPTLVETREALEMLEWLGEPLGIIESERLIRTFEDPGFGFVNVPGTSPAFLEHVHSGIVACHAHALRLRYADACTSFVIGCSRANGGFSRSVADGIPTLECTHLAVESISLLGSERMP
jgi:hypothetical protein